MADRPQLLDRWGNPVRRADLARREEVATVGSVRSPISGYPADGLDPVRLASILRDADAGDPVQYFELAETIEERDPHYLGVLGTRRRAVSQLEITVEPASDAAADEAIATEIRDWLRRDELTEELFDILDAIGKGISFTRIDWDSSSGQHQPARLDWWDPRWFRFAEGDLRTPVMLDEQGKTRPLDPYRFIYAQFPAKSGLPLRSGLARVAAWGWMFKAFSQRDWAIFTQTYGQPLRVGKWGKGASEQDKETLFRAVSNIAGDCAAIIPDSMQIDFVETANLSAGHELYERRSDWLDRQISKAVLGQTATTDAIAGGHAVGREHREVQEDIERSDARRLSAILNRDLLQPWVILNHGPQRAYPRLVIARPEQEDLERLSRSLDVLVPLGLRVEQDEIRAKFGLREPRADAAVLAAPGAPVVAESGPAGQASPLKGFLKGSRGGDAPPGIEGALQSEAASQGRSAAVSPEDLIADRLAVEAAPAMGEMLARVEAMMDAAGSLDELAEMIRAAWPRIDAGGLAGILAAGMQAAAAGGRAAIVADDA